MSLNIPPAPDAVIPAAAPANALQQQVAMQCEQEQLRLEEGARVAIEATQNYRNVAALISPIGWLPITKELLALFGETSTADYICIENAAAHLTNRQTPAGCGDLGCPSGGRWRNSLLRPAQPAHSQIRDRSAHIHGIGVAATV